MSKKKARVSAIQIEYADGESKQLSVEDARALYEQLHELFGENTVVVPSVPKIIDFERERQPEPWKRTPWYPAAPVWMAGGFAG